MQNFVVSARKYRPATWDDVVGQDQVVTTLKNAIKNNHLAQSFLFCGPRGVGKTTCARILAKTINCENISADGEACNTCESCTTFNENASFNIHEIDAASNNSVEDIRSLTDQVRYAPQAGKYKIYIIDEVHMLSAQAFNAFLKTLEEPPSYVKFILATTEKHKIIPTILSRCQIFDFNRITVKDMIRQLKKVCKNEGMEIDDEALHFIAQKADGAMRDALSIYDRIASFAGKKITAEDVIENLNILDYEYYFRITDACVTEDAATCLLLFHEITNKGFDGDTFIIGFAEHLRNLLVSKDAGTLKLLEASDTVMERYAEQSKLITASFLLSALHILNQADVQYRTSKNKRLHVELALMKLCYIHHAVNTLNIAEKKTTEVKLQPVEKRRQENVAYIKTTGKTDESKKTSVPQETVTIPKKSNIRDKIIEKQKSSEEHESLQQVRDEPPLAVTPELFLMAWKRFADEMRTVKSTVAIVMDDAEITINEHIIEIKTDTDNHSKWLKEIAPELKKFIADTIDNNSLVYHFSVKEKKVTAQPLTLKEKYKKMEDANPLIRELKDTLGFEIDY
ncbi:MAG: DNA polymerase III subunit gamma/tau [Chitinophagales bacterium]|nr:DNA polymerase III subunit gamma/tau [Chitinophagales bacterium]